MQLKCPVVAETALRAAKRPLDALQPGSKFAPTAVLPTLLAGATLVPAVHFVAKGFANLKTTLVLLDQAIMAELPDLGRGPRESFDRGYDLARPKRAVTLGDRSRECRMQ